MNNVLRIQKNLNRPQEPAVFDERLESANQEVRLCRYCHGTGREQEELDIWEPEIRSRNSMLLSALAESYFTKTGRIVSRPDFRESAEVYALTSETVNPPFQLLGSFPVEPTSPSPATTIAAAATQEWVKNRIHELDALIKAEPETTPLHLDSLRDLVAFWNRYKELPRASIMASPNGFLANTWRKEDRVFDIEFFPDGRVEWMQSEGREAQITVAIGGVDEAVEQLRAWLE